MLINGSVGSGGENRPPDVKLVQRLLRDRNIDPGPTDGLCTPRTVQSIRGFQSAFLRQPDGLVEPSGITIRKLADGLLPSDPPAPKVDGKWTGDSAQWSQEKKLESLAPAFRPPVERVIAALRAAHFQPKIFYGWRSVTVQARLYKEGKSKVRFSFHNAQLPDGTPNAWAADIIDARWGWDKRAETGGFWKALGEQVRGEGLVWGGDWASFRDWAHVQGRKNSELAAVKDESGLCSLCASEQACARPLAARRRRCWQWSQDRPPVRLSARPRRLVRLPDRCG